VKKTILMAVATLAVAYALPAYHIKQTAVLASGLSGAGRFVWGDMDHDSLPDFSFWHCADSGYVWSWQIWESRQWNRYALVQSDTCIGVSGTPPVGMHKGLLLTADIGDGDVDGLSEIVGANCRYFGDTATGQIDSLWSFLCVYESPSPDTYPDTLVWSYLYSRGGISTHAWYPGDMDRDGRKEILFNDGYQTCIFENRGDNQYDLVFSSPLYHCGFDYAFGDFDQDGLSDFAFQPWTHYVYVYECAGDDQYALVDSIYNPHHNGDDDVFPGNDLDRDGKPEFYVVYMDLSPRSIFYIYMYEATGNNKYEGKLIDSIVDDGSSCIRQSRCCDIDADGIEELLVSFNAGITVYKAVGNDSFQRVWTWYNPMPGARESQIQCYDMNLNGYQDVVVSGKGRTWMFEMEAIRVLAPNGRQPLVAGDTYRIRWRVYNPPSCDSVSLFLRTYMAADSGFSGLDTIVTGLSPSESVYSWVVPSTALDSNRIMAIAYGPGWQHDESDSSFRIVAPGIAGPRTAPPHDWSLSVSPNPTRGEFSVRYGAPRSGQVRVSLVDPCGRVVEDLVRGEKAPGWYTARFAVAGVPAGVYYVLFEPSATSRRPSAVLVRKLVVRK